MSRAARRAAGERIGPFEVVRYLASGGMGDVYVGRALDTGEDVALKFLADASPANIVRFEREGRIASTLSHPHIVAGRGLGRSDDGQIYIAMELLRGTDLEARLTGPGVTPEEAVTVAMQVCDALAHAHTRRIVHRDLKPQNIFLCEGETIQAKVLDFGIARLADDRRLTGTGMMVGTWSHMSPEQARSESDIDARADLWSLGVVLYECLAGRLPFDAPTAPSMLYHILFEQPPDLAQLCPHLPRILTDTVLKTLAKSRDDRPPSADALRSALAAVDVRGLTTKRVAVGTRQAAGHTSEAGTLSATFMGATLDGSLAPGATVENRLTAVAFLREAREPGLVQDVARQLGGRVVQLGGGLLVVFGTDRWNGDEPERAVRLAAAVAPSTRGIGVATGRALRGVAAVTGAAVDSAVAYARRDGVTLDETTAQIVRGLYPLEARDDGSAWLDPRARPSGEAIAEAVFTTPFLGRELELSMLLRAAETATSDQQPTAVVMLASSGMGKSRLRHEAVVALLRDAPETTVLMARGEAFRRDTPFAALVDALRGVVDESVARVFAAVGQDGGDPVAALDRARTSLEAVLRGLAARGTVLLAIDDVQWLDPSSQAAIRWVSENAPDLPLAVWLFGRLEARETAQQVVPGANVAELKPLPRAASEKLLRAVAGEVVEAVLERAGGHPLFLEELGRLYASRGVQSVTSTGALPPSIEGAHLAQLDQLDPSEREFLKRSAVFGRAAWLDAVVALGGDAASLERLKRQNMLVARPRSRFEPVKEFAFRAGVMQEVTYGLLPDDQRARLHERAAAWLAQREGVGQDELARHWDLAGDHERAAEAYTAAAEASAFASDAATTCAHAERAIALASSAALRWRALVARDNALQASGDRALQKSGLAEMAALADGLDPAHRAEAAYRTCLFGRMTSDREVALAAGLRAIELGEAANVPRWQSAAHNELALLFADEGAMPDAMKHAAAARRLANKTGDEWLVARSINTQAYLLVESGNPVDALEMCELSAARYSRAGDRRREAVVLANAAGLMADLGRLAEAVPRLEASIEASRRVGNARTVAAATHNLGIVRRILGDLPAAAAHEAFVAQEAGRLGYTRLAASVAGERAYLALLQGAPTPDLLAQAQLAEKLAEQSRSPAMIATARAIGLRARHAAGEPVADAAAAARALLPALDRLAEIRAELLAALYEADGRHADDLVAGRDAVTSVVARLESPEDQRAVRDALARRFLLPDGMLALDA